MKVKLKKIIAQNLKGYRKVLNLTQEAVAGQAGIHPVRISAIEREDVNAGTSLQSLEKIAKGLKIEPYLLLIPHSYKKKITIEDIPK